MSTAVQIDARVKSLNVVNLMPGLTERGKIKIGEKGRTIMSAKGKQFQPPQKLDYFKVTCLEKGPDDNYLIDEEVRRLYGDKPRVLPVRLLYDDVDLNFQSRYACFNGKTLWCAGNGRTAYRLTGANGERKEVECPCYRQNPDYQPPPGVQDKCKINGTLSVIIDGVERVGGVWKLRTTSYNSVVGILSSLALIQRLTGGPLAGLPLQMTLNPKTVIIPTSGQAMKVWVVGLEYKGTIESLQQIAFEKAKQYALHHVKIEQIEQHARALISHSPVVLDDVDPVEVIEEFYPEQIEEQIRQEQAAGNGNGNGNGNGGQPEQQAAPPLNNGEASAPKEEPVTEGASKAGKFSRRSRQNSIELDGKEVKTCGITAEQVEQVREFSRTSPGARTFVQQWIAQLTGYNDLSFLREKEASELLGRIKAQVPQVPQAEEMIPFGDSAETIAAQGPDSEEKAGGSSEEMPADLVLCPILGDKMSVSLHCHAGKCRDRERQGFCPVVDGIEDGNGLI